MAKEVEGLEHHTDLTADCIDVAGTLELNTVNNDVAGVMVLEVVDTAQ
jgi:hypothetical protein